MNWTVSYYNKAVYKSIMAWPQKICGNYLRIVDLMEQFGPNLGMPFTRAMGDGLFEIRTKGQEGIGRVFFCYKKGKNIVILHGFIKKTNNTPQKELVIARKRMAEVQKNES